MREHGHSPVFHAAIGGNQENFNRDGGSGGDFPRRSL
jgi:hypothetical protein